LADPPEIDISKISEDANLQLPSDAKAAADKIYKVWSLENCPWVWARVAQTIPITVSVYCAVVWYYCSKVIRVLLQVTPPPPPGARVAYCYTTTRSRSSISVLRAPAAQRFAAVPELWRAVIN
jgi:hypothetical protein